MMKFQVLPVFSDIFPDEPIPKKADLLATIPSDAIIRACCHINAELHNAENPFEKERMVFMGLIQRMPLVVQTKIAGNMIEFMDKVKTDSKGVFPVLHTLKLIEDSYLNYKEGSFANASPNEELGILRLLLIHNHEANEELKTRLDTIKNNLGMYQLFWTSLLATAPFLQRKDFIVCMYKAGKFLNYLEKFKPEFLKTYLDAYGLDSKMRYVWLLFELQTNTRIKDADKYASYFRSGQLDQNSIAQGMMLDLANGDRKNYENNLKGLRTSPLMKYANGDVGIVDLNFIIGKYFDGLVFDFFYKSGLSATGRNSFNEYNKDIGTNFSNPLFMDVMSKIFKKNGIIAFREEERNENCNYDFYIRIRNHIFLIEFKDIFFPIKSSFEEIKAALDERMTGAKGVGQLLKQIDKLSKTPDVFDEFGEYSLDRLFIHPVIVYTDSSFGMTGINHYLDNNFQANLSIDLRRKFFHVNPLSMIHFDFFLERFDLFDRGEIDLVDIFNTYYQKKQGFIESYQTHGSQEGFMRMFDGFDSIVNRVYSYNPKSNVGGTLYKDIVESIRPFLADGNGTNS